MALAFANGMNFAMILTFNANVNVVCGQGVLLGGTIHDQAPDTMDVCNHYINK